ncbi:beta-galactosidase [Deinococcus cellulosilyticus]|uniref:Beta-galactosidase n=1 Tax=Deinococcus cellulosilyticus (strain DSM 18568 / NBRC 106333 / KACC 11606 / 5516J-15) TaxID=1223518 RepID=A0A511MVA7_DEIC1|nr:beta-galactosidase [Deinococcus cellulosilyticus]GEM44509.1 beta-galactosidase [Deinococcus cellulosilyticus NBRC 106333 = KACC 11606]
MNILNTLGQHVLFGGDYNPEQWPEHIWHEDVQRMKEAGVNLVSVGIFGWAKLEPSEGQYEFDWLDRVLNLLQEHNIGVNLATATASPPAWFALKYPESLPVTRDGVTLGFGSRQHYSPASAVYREKAAQLVRKLAGRYGTHPAVKMWHINNEYGCHIWECFSESTAQAFRGWLQKKYQALSEVNRVWGTAFWSQTYHQWEEIQPPRAMPGFYNPTQYLDWRRFSSDMMQECMQLEVDILREVTPHIPVNTNFLSVAKNLNQRELAKLEDIVSIDIYPDPASEDAALEVAIQGDWARSMRDGQPWILMEQAPNQVQWRHINAIKKPGQMRLLSYQLMARGARGILYFQWRQSVSGSEKYHSGMLPHTGVKSRTWQEIKQLGQELKGLPLLSYQHTAEVAIIVDWDSWQALEQESHPHVQLRLMQQVQQIYRTLHRRNIAVDFTTSHHDLSKYRLVYLPSTPLMDQASAGNLKNYVRQGGCLVSAFFSGITDEHDHIQQGTDQGSYSPGLKELLGVNILEFAPQQDGTVLQLSNGWEGSMWADVLELNGATALATYQREISGPAITCNLYGEGQAYHMGTQLTSQSLQVFTDLLLENRNLKAPLDVPEGIEVVRWQDGTLFLTNPTDAPCSISLPSAMTALVGTTEGHTLQLAPMGVAVLQPQSHPTEVLTPQ